jgi:anthranilate phosphoribosyltransferase
MIQQAIKKAVDGINLSPDEARAAMEEIMSGEATPIQIAGYLTALRMKGETVDEITASAKVMREKAARVEGGTDAMDIVGTGGDCAFTFNISTVSAFVAAAAGVKIAKHGNRSVSSKCGAADLLETLGVRLDLSPQQTGKVLSDTGICFMFAQVHHSSMKYVAVPRRELGIRTIFNILGPLANPAGAEYQILGVFNEQLAQQLAQVLLNLGVKRAMIVCGSAGDTHIDELSLCGDTLVCELFEGKLHRYILRNTDFGLPSYKLEDIAGGDSAENAEITRRILAGESGAKRDMVLMNAAAALYITDKAKSLRECVEIAAQMIDSGKAAAKLEEFVRATHNFD